ncbi:hypothetical protein OV450_5723 [Actinobacteria bacterium OV450]|nr:hypothetical protein OV450_5723 [Actinobacteria bacterium OV450]
MEQAGLADATFSQNVIVFDEEFVAELLADVSVVLAWSTPMLSLLFLLVTVFAFFFAVPFWHDAASCDCRSRRS